MKYQVWGLTILPKNQIDKDQDQMVLERLKQVEKTQMQQQEDIKTAQIALERQKQQINTHVQ